MYVYDTGSDVVEPSVAFTDTVVFVPYARPEPIVIV